MPWGGSGAEVQSRQQGLPFIHSTQQFGPHNFKQLRMASVGVSVCVRVCVHTCLPVSLEARGVFPYHSPLCLEQSHLSLILLD